MYDLRGAACEILDGKERCYTEDSQGRTLCPDYVTSKYLAFPSTGVPMECLPGERRYRIPPAIRYFFNGRECMRHVYVDNGHGCMR